MKSPRSHRALMRRNVITKGHLLFFLSTIFFFLFCWTVCDFLLKYTYGRPGSIRLEWFLTREVSSTVYICVCFRLVVCVTRGCIQLGGGGRYYISLIKMNLQTTKFHLTYMRLRGPRELMSAVRVFVNWNTLNLNLMLWLN